MQDWTFSLGFDWCFNIFARRLGEDLVLIFVLIKTGGANFNLAMLDQDLFGRIVNHMM